MLLYLELEHLSSCTPSFPAAQQQVGLEATLEAAFDEAEAGVSPLSMSLVRSGLH